MQVFSRTFSSLHNRNFRNFWIGQCISTMGTWIQRTAQTWLVYQMTDSAMLVGLLTACQFLPILFLTLVAGTFVDRIPKRTILIITQSGYCLLGVIMTVLVMTGIVQYWQVLVIALAHGVLQSIDTPTRQSFVVELVGPKDLINGISLNSTIFNLAKIAGPSLAGLLMVQFSVGICFLIDAVSYLAVLAGLFLIKLDHVVATPSKQRVWQDVVEGLRCVWSHPDIRLSAVLMLIVCTLNYNNNVIIPIYAKEVLHAGAQVYANLLSATGIGSLVAAFLMSYLSRFGLRRDFCLIFALSTASLQALMLVIHQYWLAMAIMVLVGFCNMIFLNQSNAGFQFGIPANLRGRVMSVYVLLNQGTTPLGSLLVGGVMDVAGGVWGFPSGGFVALALLIPVIILNRQMIAGWLRHKAVN